MLGNSSVKKEIVQNAGIFDVSLYGYGGEDFDYSMRLFKSTEKKFIYANNIKSVQYSTRSLQNTLSLFYEYGKCNLPKILKIHPEAEPLVLHNFHKGLRKIVAIIFLNSICRPIVKMFYHIAPYPLSNLFVKILLIDSLLKGYRENK